MGPVAIQVIPLGRGEAQQQLVAIVGDRLEPEGFFLRQRRLVGRPGCRLAEQWQAAGRGRKAKAASGRTRSWCVRRGRLERDLQGPALRRIADTGVRAALVAHLQRDVARAGTLSRQQCIQAPAVGLHRAEVFVGVLVAIGHLQRAGLEAGAFGGYCRPVPVQVVAVGDFPVQGDALVGGLRRQAEGLVDGKQAGFIDRCGRQGEGGQGQQRGQTTEQGHVAKLSGAAGR